MSGDWMSNGGLERRGMEKLREASQPQGKRPGQHPSEERLEWEGR